MQPIIQVHHLYKTYTIRERQGLFRSQRRYINALENILLEIAPGESFGLIGPNGAGKTTLIKCLTTLLLPTSGTIRINGYDVVQHEALVRASIGCMLIGERGLYWKLTGRENLTYFAALYGLPAIVRTKQVAGLIQRFNLSAFIDQPVESYSSGQKKKLLIAKALINDAPVLILDEPTSTLDIHNAHELRLSVRDLHTHGRTILYTTHLLHEVEPLCNRVAIIDKGHIVTVGTPDELRARAPHTDTISLRGCFPEQTLISLRQLSLISHMSLQHIKTDQQLVLHITSPDQALPSILQIVYASGARIDDIVIQRLSFEELFLALTASGATTDSSHLNGAL